MAEWQSSGWLTLLWAVFKAYHCALFVVSLLLLLPLLQRNRILTLASLYGGFLMRPTDKTRTNLFSPSFWDVSVKTVHV